MQNPKNANVPCNPWCHIVIWESIKKLQVLIRRMYAHMNHQPAGQEFVGADKLQQGAVSSGAGSLQMVVLPHERGLLSKPSEI